VKVKKYELGEFICRVWIEKGKNMLHAIYLSVHGDVNCNTIEAVQDEKKLEDIIGERLYDMPCGVIQLNLFHDGYADSEIELNEWCLEEEFNEGKPV
jgi:hypothetical protein